MSRCGGFCHGWLRYGIDVEAGDAGMRQPRFVALAICLLAMLLRWVWALLKHGHACAGIWTRLSSYRTGFLIGCQG
jgi:hypothetical protein